MALSEREDLCQTADELGGSNKVKYKRNNTYFELFIMQSYFSTVQVYIYVELEISI